MDIQYVNKGQCKVQTDIKKKYRWEMYYNAYTVYNSKYESYHVPKLSIQSTDKVANKDIAKLKKISTKLKFYNEWTDDIDDSSSDDIALVVTITTKVPISFAEYTAINNYIENVMQGSEGEEVEYEGEKKIKWSDGTYCDG